MRTGFLFLAVLSFLFSACSGDKAEGDVSKLDEYFSKHLPADEPGGAILIMRGDSLLFSKGYGIADIETKQPITPQTLFNLGSISKTFVANAILILQERGKLSVEDSLKKYFPEFKKEDIPIQVRIKHLLTHTSGLPDNRRVAEDSVFFLTAKDEENWYPVTQSERLIFEPGTRYEYSNPAYNGLALIIERVTGGKWQDFVAENIFKPSGMTTSTITDGPHPEQGVSHGYVLNHKQWTEDDYGEEPTFPAAGNGGVWSSVEELAKYEHALRDSVFLKGETVRDSRTVKTFVSWYGNAKPTRGWAWEIKKTPDGTLTVGHSGSQGGFLCNYVTIPDKNIFFVILLNTPRDIDAFTAEIMIWLKKQKK